MTCDPKNHFRNAILELLNSVPPNKDAVWEKGWAILGRDPAEWRKDELGCLIRYSDYGNRASPYGWECDHIRPRAFGGFDTLLNSRPMQWENNNALGQLAKALLKTR